MDLSTTLKSRRKALGLTLAQISEKMGVSEATVQRWESGNIKSPRYDKIAPLADILRVQPSDIMGWTGGSGPHAEKSEDPLLEDITALYNSLNSAGKKKLREYAADLVSSWKYTDR